MAFWHEGQCTQGIPAPGPLKGICKRSVAVPLQHVEGDQREMRNEQV